MTSQVRKASESSQVFDCSVMPVDDAAAAADGVGYAKAASIENVIPITRILDKRPCSINGGIGVVTGGSSSGH